MANPFKVIQGLFEREQAIADFIQNGPSDGIRGWARDRYRDRCNEFANLPGWARALTGISGGSVNRICQPYWDDQGVDGPVNPGPPFAGGQCADVGYTVTVAGQASPPGGSGVATRSGIGPVGGMCFPDAGFGNVSIGVIFNGVCVTGGGGQALTVPSVQGTWSITGVSRDDGLPDDCGDPPDEPLEPGPNPPPNPGPLPGPEPTDDPNGDPIPIIPIPPFEDPVFGPQPFDNPEGDPPAAPSTPSGGDGLPGDPDAVGGEAGSVDGGEDGEDIDFGPPPEGRVWVGAFITTTVDTRLGNIPGTGPNGTVYPTAIGNAHLIFTGGRGTNLILRSKTSLLTRPVTALEVTGCFIQCQPGVSATVRPVSAIICPENPCEEE